MIYIDGETGEGGGQILRTSLALSMCTGKPFQIANIRAKRKKPGLLRQHLTAVNAAKSLCNANVDGGEISSQTLEFVPSEVIAGEYHFAIGTAGSTTLVLQTILPPLLCSKGVSTIRLEGGTHNPFAPPFHFISEAFFPILNRMGANCSAKLSTWGFYPAGGGRIEVTITPPTEKLSILDLRERGKLIKAEALAAVSKIPREVAEDECNLITNKAAFPVDKCKIENADSPGPGNVAMLGMEFENSRVFFTGFGEIGVSRNKVGHTVISSANKLYRSKAAIDEHMSDQLLIPMALAGGGCFTTLHSTQHTITNIEIIKKFLSVEISCEKLSGEIWEVRISKI
ncbi:MAG: RNA 3'-terminal phosphate cyclase [Candidatus Riflebacteria bacterium]|nr:RNA 3'-terminal phosphate cyclase [Candidatus Riflebacteria bacterium]